MIRYNVKKSSSKLSLGRYYARPVIEETLGLEQLSEHMSGHNSPFSQGVIYGVLTDMVKCIREQLLKGCNVKIDNLAIFSVGIRNKAGGAATMEEFTTVKNIEGVRLRCRATGELTSSILDLDATLRKTATSASGDSQDDSSADTTTDGKKCKLTITASPENGGTVSGAGEYAAGETVTISAQPTGNYKFSGWSDGNMQNPRSLTISSDTALTASFELQSDTEES